MSKPRYVRGQTEGQRKRRAALELVVHRVRCREFNTYHELSRKYGKHKSWSWDQMNRAIAAGLITREEWDAGFTRIRHRVTCDACGHIQAVKRIPVDCARY